MSTPHGFWVEYTDNRVFDGVVTRHLVAYGGIVVIHGFHDSVVYPFHDIADRLHRLRLGIRVLFYTWAGRKRLRATTIAAVPTLDGLELPDHFDLLLKDAQGRRVEVTKDGQTFIVLDPRIEKARTWLRDQVSTEADLVGSDGAGLDIAIRTPRFPGQDVNLKGYPKAFDLMIQGVSDATSMTIFNGLSVPRPDQENLLAFTHGAAIEFFGLNDRVNRRPTFADDILRYLDVIGRHADRVFLVFGRASRRPQAYTTYDEDWLWQRYLYCAYLLAAGPNTRWKQHAGFRAVPNSGRAGGLDVYADALRDLGSARGKYTVEDGCYRRAFEQGLVLIVPAEAPGPTTVWINRPTFTLDGARIFAGQFTVAPGEGHVLFYRRPAPPPALIHQFDTGLDPLWRWSELREESGAYLHLKETPAGEECEHDLALDLVRYRAPRGQLTLWYRTSDPAARVEIVVEVDDTNRALRFALVDGSLQVGSDQSRRAVQFRAVAPDVSQFERLPVVVGGTPMSADGQWHILGMDLEKACACAVSGRYQFRRALFARLLGSLDIRRVHLADRAPSRTAARRDGALSGSSPPAAPGRRSRRRGT